MELMGKRLPSRASHRAALARSSHWPWSGMSWLGASARGLSTESDGAASFRF